MFNGIIKHTGEFVKLEPKSNGYFSLMIKTPNFSNGVLSKGDSLAVNGACLTVVDDMDGILYFDLLQETLDKTNLGMLDPGNNVNLEQSLQLQDYISGHLVTGHVDFVSTLIKVENEKFTFELPLEFKQLVASKGSVTINGVALTSCDVENDCFSVYLIPETLSVTNLSDLKIGSKVNIEIDPIARYVQRILTNK